ncbi:MULTISPECIES: phage holin family protein [Pseudomonas]|jgi:uncharacterized membrane protein YqjE|uniref:Phage holin family protein n=1 Tax=Pseudomonas oryzihabitans TaxID=47885 RepID=A0A0U4VLQ8_9PSED|nr:MULTISPECIES: phage holin family protein [Pseudomonas]ALZ84096.1 hypothetical protein APT59_07665 [Pseudomonas oryzihabitans]WCE08878.1 phage holin family protein [Pseudomonas sp. JBR1]HAC67788.1 hypothetical protein [Pseudomonas sp.]
MDTSSPPRELPDEAPKPSVKRLAGAVVGLLQSHLELLGIEVQEEKVRTFQLFLFTGLSLIFGLLVLVGISAAVIIAFWDTYRMTATLALCGFYAVALAICILRALRLVKGAAPFHATLEELNRNRERLLP